jgi:hypothetical protein
VVPCEYESVLYYNNQYRVKLDDKWHDVSPKQIAQASNNSGTAAMTQQRRRDGTQFFLILSAVSDALQIMSATQTTTSS